MGEDNRYLMGAGNLKTMTGIKTNGQRPFFSLKNRILIYFGMLFIVSAVILMQTCFKGKIDQSKTARQTDNGIYISRSPA